MKYQFLFLFLILIVSLSFTNIYEERSIEKSELFDGKETYETFCIACHQADGKGQIGVNPPLVGSDWVKGDKSKFIKTVLQGLTEPIEVNGVKYNNAMPAFDYIEDAELATLLTFVRNKFGETTDSVTVAEVKSVRDSIK
jgi:mono/diheme cytochrome c family protein